MTPAAAVTRRRAVAAEAAFVDALLEADARDELAALPEPVRGDLARTQVRARRASYAGSCPDAVEWLILLDGSPVGRLLLDPGQVSVHIVDIRLEADARGRGVGTEVLVDVCAEAHRLGLDVTLSARAGSDAEGWYRRNGFVDAAERGADEADVVLVRRADR
jgi:ribosomal protein S18 acetylase RimI-like enzyme